MADEHDKVALLLGSRVNSPGGINSKEEEGERGQRI